MDNDPVILEILKRRAASQTKTQRQGLGAAATLVKVKSEPRTEHLSGDEEMQEGTGNLLSAQFMSSSPAMSSSQPMSSPSQILSSDDFTSSPPQPVLGSRMKLVSSSDLETAELSKDKASAIDTLSPWFVKYGTVDVMRCLRAYATPQLTAPPSTDNDASNPTTDTGGRDLRMRSMAPSPPQSPTRGMVMSTDKTMVASVRKTDKLSPPSQQMVNLRVKIEQDH